VGVAAPKHGPGVAFRRSPSGNYSLIVAPVSNIVPIDVNSRGRITGSYFDMNVTHGFVQ